MSVNGRFRTLRIWVKDPHRLELGNFNRHTPSKNHHCLSTDDRADIADEHEEREATKWIIPDAKSSGGDQALTQMDVKARVIHKTSGRT